MLRLDYEALADSSRTLIEQGDIFEECIERMTQVIDALPDIWEAIFQFDTFHPIQVALDTPESDDTGSRWLRYSWLC